MVDRPTDDLTWAEDAESLIDEPTNERDRGWSFRHIPPADQVNWLQRATGRWVDWLSRGGNFNEARNLIDALEPGDCAPLLDENNAGKYTQIAQVPSPVKSMDTDGRYVVWASNDGFVRSAPVEDLSDQTAFDLSSINSDITTTPSQSPTVLTSGDVVIALFEVDNQSTGFSDVWAARLTPGTLELEQDRAIADSEVANDSLISAVIAGDRFYATVDTIIYRNFAWDTQDLTQQVSTYDDTEVRIAATNGRYVIAQDVETAGDEILILNKDLDSITLLEASAFGGENLSSDVEIAMDKDRFYVPVSNTNELFVFSIPNLSGGSGLVAESKSTTNDDRLVIDHRRLYIKQIAGDDGSWVVYDKDTLQPVSYMPNDQASNLNNVESDGEFEIMRSDGQYMYIYGTFDADFGAGVESIEAIAAVALAPDAGVWRRLDPTDDNSWTRTLAAPI